MGNPEPFSEDNDFMFFQHYSIFYSSFKELTSLVASQNQDQLSKILTRMLEGLHDSFLQFKDRIKQVRKYSGEVITKLSHQINSLNLEFQEYRSQNDLELYFNNHLSKDTRNKVI